MEKHPVVGEEAERDQPTSRAGGNAEAHVSAPPGVWVDAWMFKTCCQGYRDANLLIYFLCLEQLSSLQQGD